MHSVKVDPYNSTSLWYSVFGFDAYSKADVCEIAKCWCENDVLIGVFASRSDGSWI